LPFGPPDRVHLVFIPSLRFPNFCSLLQPRCQFSPLRRFFINFRSSAPVPVPVRLERYFFSMFSPGFSGQSSIVGGSSLFPPPLVFSHCVGPPPTVHLPVSQGLYLIFPPEDPPSKSTISRANFFVFPSSVQLSPVFPPLHSLLLPYVGHPPLLSPMGLRRKLATFTAFPILLPPTSIVHP